VLSIHSKWSLHLSISFDVSFSRSTITISLLIRFLLKEPVNDIRKFFCWTSDLLFLFYFRQSPCFWCIKIMWVWLKFYEAYVVYSSFSAATLVTRIFTYFHIHVRVGFEVLTAVVTKSSIFSDITPCSPLKASRHVPTKLRLNFNGLHGVASQETELFMFVFTSLILDNYSVAKIFEYLYLLGHFMIHSILWSQ
jgi:hypothetical protein